MLTLLEHKLLGVKAQWGLNHQPLTWGTPRLGEAWLVSTQVIDARVNYILAYAAQVPMWSP
jgi:hypothetical protein